MTSKHRLTCIAISAAVALKLFAGTADAGVSNGETDARKGRVLLTVLHDASGRLDAAKFYAVIAPLHLGGGIDIATVDGEVVNS